MLREFLTDLKNEAIGFLLQIDSQEISNAKSQNNDNLKSSNRILAGHTASGTVLYHTDLTEDEFAEYDDKRASKSSL